MKIVLTSLTLVLFALLASLFQRHAPFLLAQIHALGFVGPVCFIGLYALATLLFFPTMVLTFAGGGLFGPWLGTVYNLSGAVLGASLAFLLSRRCAHVFQHMKWFSRLKRILPQSPQRAWRMVAFLRVVPIVPFNLVNYGFGLTPIAFRHYVLATVVFMAPPEMLYTYCGYAGIGLLRHPLSLKHILIAVIAVVLLIVFYGLVIRLRRTKSPLQSPP